MRWLDGITYWMDMSLIKLWQSGSLACCSPWSHEELDTTNWLNWTKHSQSLLHNQWSRSRFFFPGIPFLSLWSNERWQFYLGFLCIFETQPVPLEFSVHILVKSSLKDFEHNLASMWNEFSCEVVWTSLVLLFFGIGMKTDLFQSCGHCWVFQICWHIECSTLTASLCRIFNSFQLKFYHLH